MTTEAPKKLRENCIDLHTHGFGDWRDFSSIDKAEELGLTAIAIGMRGGGIMQSYADLIDYVEKRDYKVKILTLTECNFAISPGIYSDFVAIDFDLSRPRVVEWHQKLQTHNSTSAYVQQRKMCSEGWEFYDLEPENADLLSSILSGYEPERSAQFAKILATSKKNASKVVALAVSLQPEWDEAEGYYKTIYQDSTYVTNKLIYRFLFGPGKKYFEPAISKDITLTVFSETFRAAGGKIFYSPEEKFHHDEWEKFKDYVDGVMLWHGGKIYIPGAVNEREIIKTLRRDGKIITGGSDYDPLKNHWQIGVGDGSMKISDRRFSKQ